MAEPTMKFMDGSGFDAQGNAIAAPIKTADIKIDPGKSVPAESLADSITSGDINSLLKQNQANFQEQLKAFDYTPEYLNLKKQFSDTQNQLRGLQTNYVQNQVGIKNKPIPMDEIGNELTRLQENVAYRELPLTNQLQAITGQLNVLQEERNNTLAKLQLMADQGRYDASLAMQFNQIMKQEQKEARQLAREYKITTPFYLEGGTVYRTSDGKAYSNPDAFFADAGVTSFDEARTFGKLIELSELQGNQEDKALVMGLISQYPDAGIQPTDNYATAAAKLQNSRIYQEQVRPPMRGGGGPGSSVSVPGLGNLTNTQIDNINPLVTAFQNSPITQNYNTIAEGYEFAMSIPTNTTNPADDQALIYAFAKAMDPGSVVREGEYSTVQKYAQSWAQSYGKSFTQAINGTGFLSQDARNNIKRTIASRYEAADKNYSNLYSETARRINIVAGIPSGGEQFLNNYAGGYAQSQSNVAGPEVPPSMLVDIQQKQQQTTQQSTPATESFWSKAKNWLFG